MAVSNLRTEAVNTVSLAPSKGNRTQPAAHSLTNEHVIFHIWIRAWTTVGTVLISECLRCWQVTFCHLWTELTVSSLHVKVRHSAGGSNFVFTIWSVCAGNTTVCETCSKTLDMTACCLPTSFKSIPTVHARRGRARSSGRPGQCSLPSQHCRRLTAHTLHTSGAASSGGSYFQLPDFKWIVWLLGNKRSLSLKGKKISAAVCKVNMRLSWGERL